MEPYCTGKSINVPTRLGLLAQVLDPMIFAGSLVTTFFILSEFSSTFFKAVDSILLVLWLMAAFAMRPGLFLHSVKAPKYRMLAAFLLYYLTGLVLSMGIWDAFRYFLAALMIFSPMLIYDYYRSARPEYARGFLYATVGLLVYLSLRTFIYLSTNAGLARAVSSTRQFGDIGIGGGFMLASSLSLLLPATVYLLSEDSFKKSYRSYSLLIVITMLFYYTVYKCDYTMAFLTATLLGITVFLVAKLRRISIIGLILLTAAIAVGILLFTLYFNYLPVSGEGRQSYISKRVGELISSLNGRELSSDLKYRIDSFPMSLQVFTQYPLSGIGFFQGFDNAKGLLALGNHSEWADALAKWGLLGAVPYLGVIIMQIKSYRVENPDARSGLQLLTGIAVFITGIFNPCYYAAFFAMISVVIPGLQQLLCKPCRMEARS